MAPDSGGAAVAVTRHDRAWRFLRRRARRPRWRSIRAGLATACALVGIHAAPALAGDVDTALLYYGEASRVTAIESILNLKQDFGAGRTGNFKLVLDALTGASPTGATPARQAQTFSGPSGRSGYTVAPGANPVDSAFKDQRFELSADGAMPLDRVTTGGLGVRFSGEKDYTSVGMNTSLARDFNQRNTTLSASLSFDHDTSSPKGGPPLPFTILLPPAPHQEGEGDGGGGGGLGKNVLGVAFGATQVLDRSTLLQLSYTIGRVAGYQTDPYKLLSVLDQVSAEPLHYLHESRPDARTRHVYYAQLKRDLGPFAIDGSYRYAQDTWGIHSRTWDFHWRWDTSEGNFWQPHVRFYRQTAADFYRRFLIDGAALPAFASADSRLGAFNAWTFGLKRGLTLANGHLLTMRAEYYRQTGEHHPAQAYGDLTGLDLFPDMSAVIVQVGYSFGI